MSKSKTGKKTQPAILRRKERRRKEQVGVKEAVRELSSRCNFAQVDEPAPKHSKIDFSTTRTIVNDQEPCKTVDIVPLDSNRRVVVGAIEPIKRVEKVFKESSTQTDEPKCEFCTRHCQRLTTCTYCTRFLVTYRDEYIANLPIQEYKSKKRELNDIRQGREDAKRAEQNKRKREAENSVSAYSHLISRLDSTDIVNREDRKYAYNRNRRPCQSIPLNTTHDKSNLFPIPPLMSLKSNNIPIIISPEPTSPPTNTIQQVELEQPDEFSMNVEIQFPTVDFE